MVLFVFANSKSILGLCCGKKCSEIVSFFFLDVCRRQSTNRDLTFAWFAFSVVQDGIFDRILAGGISFQHQHQHQHQHQQQRKRKKYTFYLRI